MALLEVEAAVKIFPGVRALDGVSLAVEKGAVHGLIGPNGSGKSTMIACIMGNYDIDGGEIRYKGKALGKTKVWDRVRAGINATNQTAVYVADLSVRRHIELGIMINGFPETDVDRVAEITGLTESLDELPSALSAVGARRLEIAKALSTRPSLLMLDECFAGLSHEEGEGVVDIIRAVVADHEMTILVVDHNLGLVEAIADQTTVIDRGKIISEGTFEEIVNDPVVVEAYMG